MNNMRVHAAALAADGYSIIENIYTPAEIYQLLTMISSADTSADTFRKSAGLFAIRQFLKELPAAADLIFNGRLKALLHELCGPGYFVVKSIYFDKPGDSNWYVAYHQDLTVSLDQKLDMPGYGPWTVKQAQFAVQPPVHIMQNITTFRIHLDDTDEANGALRILRGSHAHGIVRPETIDRAAWPEINCNVKQGGVMVMKPLLLHSSGKTTNKRSRRVIHIEFSSHELADGLTWSEYMQVEY